VSHKHSATSNVRAASTNIAKIANHGLDIRRAAALMSVILIGEKGGSLERWMGSTILQQGERAASE